MRKETLLSEGMELASPSASGVATTAAAAASCSDLIASPSATPHNHPTHIRVATDGGDTLDALNERKTPEPTQTNGTGSGDDVALRIGKKYEPQSAEDVRFASNQNTFLSFLRVR
jgi:hypothetical protein